MLHPNFRTRGDGFRPLHANLAPGRVLAESILRALGPDRSLLSGAGRQALMWLCADLVLGGDMGWSSSEPLVPEPSPSPIAPSCVTRHRARSKLLDQDTDRSDASRRVNSLIFTLGAPAGNRSRPPGGPGAHHCGGKAPPRRPLRPGVTRLSCRRACRF